ncbi:unnamed protein product [Rotaria sordida]|uniref:Coiled-coil domain-containing protein 181 n=1 Tax=Rotaria sordida TaxID=392033 RepID=A0A815GMK4_9BILA|nr:unnamed protein product [Rotaria sordida]CAF1340203.1 unnamed protein product [Rotaria sordida]
MTMATATSTFASYDRSIPPSSAIFRMSNNPTLSRQNHDFFTTNTNTTVPRYGHCLDDMDILTLKRQYANIDLFDQSTLSNSAEDLSQLDRPSYECDIFGQDENDIDDYDIPYDDGYDYNLIIQERLKKANEEFEHDQTPAELKHRQRVSFDAIVKAVDIIQDPTELDHDDDLVRRSIPPVLEESSTTITSPRSETSTHEYTVPLNDTQPKEGLTLLQQIKALQFHNAQLINERWASTTDNENNDNLLNREDDLSVSSCKSNENNNETQNMLKATSNSTVSKKAMIVAVNGRFDLQDEDDYIAKHHMKSTTTTNNNNKISFLPAPPTEPKKNQDLPHRPFPVRPKSSDSGRRTNTNSANLSSDKNTKIQTTTRQRPKSAGTVKNVETYTDKPLSGIDFNELLRKAAEKKRAELREERRKKKEAEEKRQQELAKAEESYKRWLREKDSERKRINEEKRLEKEELETRQAEEEKELTDLREKKYKEWLERKGQETKIANEFKKLKADENEMISGSSSSSVNNASRDSNHRAFQRWLRRKYEQSMEQKRQLHLEAKRQRRRQRRSLKRHQLQQDLQLAKSFGYS